MRFKHNLPISLSAAHLLLLGSIRPSPLQRAMCSTGTPSWQEMLTLLPSNRLGRPRCRSSWERLQRMEAMADRAAAATVKDCIFSEVFLEIGLECVFFVWLALLMMENKRATHLVESMGLIYLLETGLHRSIRQGVDCSTRATEAACINMEQSQTYSRALALDLLQCWSSSGANRRSRRETQGERGSEARPPKFHHSAKRGCATCIRAFASAWRFSHGNHGTFQLVDPRRLGLRTAADDTIHASTLGCLGLGAGGAVVEESRPV
ncbi:hypothetical protein KC356_g203 [Hortaea werneckii]|nr:hypothetical protein KC356_g203 [Hortaea werneckii]